MIVPDAQELHLRCWALEVRFTARFTLHDARFTGDLIQALSECVPRSVPFECLWLEVMSLPTPEALDGEPHPDGDWHHYEGIVVGLKRGAFVIQRSPIMLAKGASGVRVGVKLELWAVHGARMPRDLAVHTAIDDLQAAGWTRSMGSDLVWDAPSTFAQGLQREQPDVPMTAHR